MADYSELKKLLDACRAENCDGPREFQKACEALFDVCSIETIAGLVAENERIAQASSCHLLRAQTVEAERDQLKTEIAGLRTGYEAYERVNAGLRKAVSDARDFLMHEAEVRGFLDESDKVSCRHPKRKALIDSIDAAMGKGEQS